MLLHPASQLVPPLVRRAAASASPAAVAAHRHARPLLLRRAYHTGLSAADAQAAARALGIEPWTGYGGGVENAVTLPASWYTSPAVLQLEKRAVLHNSWQMVGSASQLSAPGDYSCGTLAGVRFMLVRGHDGQLRAFHNVCRHHAAAVATGCGNNAALQFECPYHGWTYDDRGRLVKATRLRGIKGFKAATNGLHPIALDTWGDCVFLHLRGGGGAAADSSSSSSSRAEPPGVAAWLGDAGERLQQLGMADASLCWLARREYVLECNWKVFCDNYLDGGLHVPFAHKDLASGLDLDTYTNEVLDVASIQRCSAAKQQQQPAAAAATSLSSSSGSGQAPAFDRLAGGREPGYTFVYPNLMMNRYGPWLDTNTVVPVDGGSVDRCRVTMDYWLDTAAVNQVAGPAATAVAGSGARPPQAVLDAALRSQFVQDSLRDSHQVQVEDVRLCEAVQQGLQEPSYGVGRYAPGPEAPMFHFHELLYAAVCSISPVQ